MDYIYQKKLVGERELQTVINQRNNYGKIQKNSKLNFQIRSKIDWKTSLESTKDLKSHFTKFLDYLRAKFNFEKKKLLKIALKLFKTRIFKI